nr:cation channel sperm-associated protein 3 isoform X2 [Symphalangus syndactylus]
MSQRHHQRHSRVISSSPVDTTSVGFCPTFKKFKRNDDECRAFVKRVIMSHFFEIIMISTVTSNAFFMALWTSYDIRYRLFRLLETLITAVGQTVYTVASVLLLLFLLMYIFAILGFCLFGSPDNGDHDNWGNLAAAFFTLFSLATVDGWTDLQKQLDNREFALSRAFTIIFILLASFIFLNMFVGVMIMHTEDSIKKFERELMLERQEVLMGEKQVILQRQREEISRLMHIQKNADCRSFSELVENFKKTLRHTDPMVLDDFGTSLPFIDIYFSTLDYQDTTVHKLQELYYEIVHVLSLMLEDLPQEKPQSLEKVDEK